GLNPFGEESDSEFAWKERYKQQQYQTQTLQATLSEIKSELQNLKEEHDNLVEKFQNTSSELQIKRAEVIEYKENYITLEQEIHKLKESVQTAEFRKIKEENDILKEELLNLKSEITRGNHQEEKSSDLMSTIIPIMLREFDTENERYQDSFENLLDVAFKEGDTFAKIISQLIHNKGKMQYNTLKEAIPNEEFPMAIDILKEENILKVVESEILLYSAKEDVTNTSNWSDMSMEELLNTLELIMEQESTSIVISSLDNFRDILQEKELPLTTIFFEIRKMSEALGKGSLSRSDGIEKIKQWKEKILNL
ncbi:MAG: hypothetical protein OEZ01_18165, partial [Candidatus Heimdallarchaeota archaeon]|nr:hypothetical protein [Candidatus Heimdallarchaeota archaeon]